MIIIEGNNRYLLHAKTGDTFGTTVNTANVIFCLATLYLIFRARSGATIAISRLLQVQAWEMVIPPLSLIYLLIAALIAAAFSFFITKYMGKQFALLFTKLPYRKLLIGIIFFLFALVFIFTGVLGLLTLLVATCIGLVPIHFGIRRSNCMGVMMLEIKGLMLAMCKKHPLAVIATALCKQQRS